ncbi:MAG: hypothetical protein BWY54_00775 [Candidatus Dependentiae bacterium ADurb.Bin331]|nr:MAG: hypothetical protein BWY54_00775 [Candidatus Dependentiae bacterium ADurb.Bin331]
MMQKSKIFSLFLVCNLLFTTNANLQAQPPIINALIKNKNTIYALSFLITGTYFILGKLLAGKREQLADIFIPWYQEHTAYLAYQQRSLNNFWENPAASHYRYYINWSQFYDWSSPTRKIAKKLKKLYTMENFCHYISAFALSTALMTLIFTTPAHDEMNSSKKGIA